MSFAVKSYRENEKIVLNILNKSIFVFKYGEQIMYV